MTSQAAFGGPSTTFSAPNTSSFGQPAPAPVSGGMIFGMSPNVAAPSQSHPLQTSSTFGQSSSLGPVSTPFGSSTPFAAAAAPGPFGSRNTSYQSTFGSSPSSNPFGSHHQQQQQQPAQGTGGVTTLSTASAPGLSFGTSSNVVQSTSTPPQSFSSSNQFPGTASPWGASTFGTSKNNTFSSSQSDDDDNMMSPTSSPQPRYMSNSPIPKKKDREEASRSSLPFGKPASLSKSGDSSSPFGVSSSTRSDRSSREDTNPQFGRTTGKTDTFAGTTASAFGAGGAQEQDDKKRDGDLARINAELETLREKLKKKKAAATVKKETKRSSELNPNAPSFEPKPRDDTDDNNKALAVRNAARFSVQNDSSATRAHLPADLKQQQQQKPSLHVHAGEHQREDLHSAVSLVGTCEHMCPDEELLRRERESDIQLLEMPMPGKIHPSDWTLRNTVVKRFRRSAADYKLDVPEWIRPPDVLEKVVGYLEEWVMVRMSRH